jgi:hypothetical protein
MFNYNKLMETAVKDTPFPHFILPNLITKEHLEEIHEHYPSIEHAGSFPVQELKYGEKFDALVQELNSSTFQHIIEEKFQLALKGLPTITTVRGRCSSRDGSIHTDSVTKIITILLYMNSTWGKPGGQLRLLRNGTDIENYFAEIPPEGGTMLAFKVTENSWHGHLPFEGQRRVVQFNWLTSGFIAKKELIRHRISYKIKKLKKLVKQK